MNKSFNLVVTLAATMVIICTVWIMVVAEDAVIQVLTVMSCLFALSGGVTLYVMAIQDKKREQLFYFKKSLHVLQQKRHDWMNGIQLLYGYAKLQKHDRVLKNIEQLSEYLKQESHISKIGDPRLEWFLYEYSANSLKFDLRYHFEPQMSLWDVNVDRMLLYEAVSRTAKIIEQVAIFSEREEPHVLTIKMGTLKKSVVKITYQYDGLYDQATARTELELLERKFVHHQSAVKLTSECQADHLLIELKLLDRV